jgi:peroxiredoxin
MSRATRRQSRHASSSNQSKAPQRARPSAPAAAARGDPQDTAQRAASLGSSAPERHAAQPAPQSPKAPDARRFQRLARDRRRAMLLKAGGAVVIGIVALGVIFYASHSGAAGVEAGQAGQYPFSVASPAKGALAPDFTLPSTAGGAQRLSNYRGKTVLLYFQEGIGCEGCWTQLKDIQDARGAFQRLNISVVLTITTNPLSALQQKVADEGITEPVLSDESFTVSRAYNAMAYGMMAGSADGHTFILVGPDGRIRWRADYGGPPNYTMLVPVDNLVADIKAGLNGN